MDESVYEQAQRLTERTTEAAIEAARAIPQEVPIEEDGLRFCLDCYKVIPPLRLAVVPHAVRCVDCQEVSEYRARR